MAKGSIAKALSFLGDRFSSSPRRSEVDSNSRAPAEVHSHSNGTSDPTEIKFGRLALITGHPLYWTTSAVDPNENADNADKVGRLLSWCVGLPGARLGVQARGIGLIVRSVYAQRGQTLPRDIDDLLKRAGANEEAMLWPTDGERFGDNSRLDRLLEYMQQAKTPEDFVWIEPAEAEWWIDAMVESLKEYVTVLQTDAAGTQDQFLNLFNRHSCALFAPFEGYAFLEHLERSLGGERGLLDDESYQELLEECQNLTQDISKYRGTVYWSWLPINFASSRDDLVDIPLLALWSDRPSSSLWAPPPSETREGTTHVSPEQATFLFEEVLKRLETIFTRYLMLGSLDRLQ